MAKTRGKKPTTQAETSTVGRDGRGGVAKRGRGNGGNRGGNRGRGRGDEAPAQPEVSLPSVDVTRFYNKAACESFQANFADRPLHHDRGMTLSKVPPTLRTLLKNLHWQDFVAQPTVQINETLVKEFYAHGKNMIAKDLCVQATIPLRGHTITIDRQLFIDQYGIPDHPFDDQNLCPLAITLRLDRFALEKELDRIVPFIATKEVVWKCNRTNDYRYFHPGYLKEDCLYLFHFINSRIKPTSHSTGVHVERALLLYYITQAIPFDLISVMWSSMEVILTSPKSNKKLPFGALITSIVTDLKIPIYETDLLADVTKPISKKIIKLLQRPPPLTLPIPNPPGSTRALYSDLFKMYHDWRVVTKVEFERKKVNDALKRRRKLLKGDDPAFYPERTDEFPDPPIFEYFAQVFSAAAGPSGQENSDAPDIEMEEHVAGDDHDADDVDVDAGGGASGSDTTVGADTAVNMQ